MAEDSELIGGISVSLGASDARLASDLANAERLVQAWVKDVQAQAQININARFAGGTGGGGGGAAAAGGTDVGKAIQEGFASLRFQATPARQQPPARPVVGPGAQTAALSQQGMTAFQRALSEQASTVLQAGEVYDPLTNEITKLTDSIGDTRTELSKPIRPTTVPVEMPPIDVDTAPVKEQVGSLIEALTSATAAINAFAANLAKVEIAAQAAPQAAPATETAPATPRGRRQRGAQQRARTAAPAAPVPEGEEGEEEEGRLGFQTRMAASEMQEAQRGQARVQQVRRTGAQRAFAESERARAVELASTRRFYNSAATLVDDFFSHEEERLGGSEEARRLTELSYEAQQASGEGRASRETATGGQPGRVSGTFQQGANVARQPLTFTPEQRAAREERDRRQADQANAGRQNTQRVSQQRAAAERETVRAFEASERVRQQNVDQEQIERTVRSRRAAITASGQTGRTAAFGLGALFGGQRGAQIEAQATAVATARQLRGAEAAIEPLDQRLRGLAKGWQESTGANRAFNREQFIAIRRSSEYQKALGNVKNALTEDAAAQERLNKLTAPSSVARNLLAGAAGGAAYGLAITAAGEAFKLFESAAAPAIDSLTGFSSLSTKVTSDLAAQTAAMHGNANAAIAQASVTAGLSADTSEYLSTQLRLTTQVKAGALAQREATNLFRANLGQGQGAPQGLLGGFGGLGGSAIFGEQLGGGRGFAEQITAEFGDFNRAIQDVTRGAAPNFDRRLTGPGVQNGQPPLPVTAEQQAEITRIATARGQAEQDLNDAAKRGATALGLTADSVVHFRTVTDNEAKQIAASNLPDELKKLASESREGLVTATNGLILSYKEATDGLSQAAVGRGIPDVATIGRANLAAEQQRQRESAASLDAIRSRQAFERPAVFAAAEREQQFQLQTQIPAQQALANLAQPLPAVGTGQVAANADEQERITAGQQESIKLQDQLNSYYEQGKQILLDTYKIPPQLISSIQSVGQSIADTQAGIRNEQAAYQVAQYNFQLHIARRTLADIGGLTGKNFGAGQSYLGVLERQNLALSRQAQLLQFALSQRQINFQQAVAGFETPGVTPEERQARVKEAQIETSYAQKQLDIQRQMFGNQVQIVDISNLRQGRDLAAQISLLLQGRALTIDTLQAEEKIARLMKIQQKQVAEAGTYINKIDKLVGQAFSDIQQLEIAAGKAMAGVAQQVLQQYGLVIQGLTEQLRGVNFGTGTGGKGPTSASGAASGTIFSTTGTTSLTVGEAGTETVAVLRNPRPLLGAGLGGGSTSITFSGDMYVRTEADIAAIARKVEVAMGRKASQVGLRQIG